ncbi:MAG: Ldh family oxidoreductase [Ignisphaera sp.]
MIRVRVYVEGIEKGYVKPCGILSIVRDENNVIVADGNNCLGIPVAAKAMRIAIERAKRFGMGIAAVRSLGHVGMLAYYSIMAANEKLIGFACANGSALAVPFGGSKPLFGTNPFTIAFPTKSKPIVIDMATSAMASYKIRLAAMRVESIPEGVAIDSEGRITRDPSKVYALLPFGGYKGVCTISHDRDYSGDFSWKNIKHKDSTPWFNSGRLSISCT